MRHLRYILRVWRGLSENWLIAVTNKFVPLLFLISLALLLWKWHNLPPFVPLWYAKPWGEEQLAQPVWLLLLPVGSLLIYLINIIVASYITADILIFSQALFSASFLVSLFSFITLIKILFLIS